MSGDIFSLSEDERQKIVDAANEWLRPQATVDEVRDGFFVLWFPDEGETDPDEQEDSMMLPYFEDFEEDARGIIYDADEPSDHEDFFYEVNKLYMDYIKHSYYECSAQ